MFYLCQRVGSKKVGIWLSSLELVLRSFWFQRVSRLRFLRTDLTTSLSSSSSVASSASSTTVTSTSSFSLLMALVRTLVLARASTTWPQWRCNPDGSLRKRLTNRTQALQMSPVRSSFRWKHGPKCDSYLFESVKRELYSKEYKEEEEIVDDRFPSITGLEIRWILRLINRWLFLSFRLYFHIGEGIVTLSSGASPNGSKTFNGSKN